MNSVEREFGSTERLTSAIFKSALELGKGTTFYYFRSVRGSAPDLVTTCSDGDDTEFAVEFLDAVADWFKDGGSSPVKFDLSVPNRYQFEAAFVLSSDYHGHLKGILDDKHATLFLAVPIHRCEFSGTETPREYRWWQVRVGVERWRRKPFPYVSMAFRNPKSDYSSPMERTSLEMCVKNLAALEGVTEGFAEIKNYKGEILSIRPRNGHRYGVATIADEFECKADAMVSLITSFVTTGTIPTRF